MVNYRELVGKVSVPGLRECHLQPGSVMEVTEYIKAMDCQSAANVAEAVANLQRRVDEYRRELVADMIKSANRAALKAAVPAAPRSGRCNHGSNNGCAECHAAEHGVVVPNPRDCGEGDTCRHCGGEVTCREETTNPEWVCRSDGSTYPLYGTRHVRWCAACDTRRREVLASLEAAAKEEAARRWAEYYAHEKKWEAYDLGWDATAEQIVAALTRLGVEPVREVPLVRVDDEGQVEVVGRVES